MLPVQKFDQPKVGIVGKHDSWITDLSVPVPTSEKTPKDPKLLLPGVLSWLHHLGLLWFRESVPNKHSI